MGFFNPGLLRAAAKAVKAGHQGAREGKAEGLKNRRLDEDRIRDQVDRQRNIEEDVLRRSMLEFNFGEAKARPAQQAAAAQREATELAALRGQSPDGEFANLSRGTIENILQERAKPKEVKPPELVEDATGRLVEKKLGVNVQSQRAPSAAAVAAQDQMPIVDESYNALEEIESRDPRIGNRVIAKANKARQFSVGKVVGGLVGKFSGTRSEEDQKALTEQAIINSLTPDEARWYAAQKGFISGVLPALGGKALTINEVITHGGPMFSTGEESDESLAQKLAQRRARYQSTRSRAGVKGDVPKRAETPKPSDRARGLVGRVK